jgi:hypothetical protein
MLLIKYMDDFAMSPTRLGGNIMFYVQKFVISSCINVPNTCINGVVNFLQTIFSNRNIVKHIVCIHYTENRADNYGILLWMETPQKSAIQ